MELTPSGPLRFERELKNSKRNHPSNEVTGTEILGGQFERSGLEYLAHLLQLEVIFESNSKDLTGSSLSRKVLNMGKVLIILLPEDIQYHKFQLIFNFF